LIFWLVKSVLSDHQWKYAQPSIVYFSPSIGMRAFSPISNITVGYIILDHCHLLHNEQQHILEHRPTRFYCLWPCAMDSTLTCGLHSVLAWLLVVCSVCASLVDYYVLWDAVVFMLIQRPLRFKKVEFVCGTHLGSRRFHMKIIGGRTSNLYVLIIEQIYSLDSWFKLILENTDFR
jgi:hypothetical protein